MIDITKLNVRQVCLYNVFTLTKDINHNDFTIQIVLRFLFRLIFCLEKKIP